MDAIALLKSDHRTVEDLFKKFEKAGEGAQRTKAKLVERMVHELSVHAAVEETTFYPFVKGVNEKLTSNVLEGLEEHHVVKWLLSELDGMSPDEERFDAKVSVLMESVRHHVEEEEGEMFPQVRKAVSRAQLDDLGALIERAKKSAPTRPHPAAPDEPPGNVVSGLVAGLIDRVRDSASSVVGEAASAGRRATSRGTSRPTQTRKRAVRKVASTRKAAATRTRKAASKARKATTRSR